MGDVLVVAGDQVVGARHEAGELAAAVGAQEVGSGLGNEDVVLASGDGLLDKEELVAGIDDDGMVVLHPQRDLDHGTAARVDVALVADEVAHAIDEQYILVIFLAVAHFHRLHDMGMSADDEVHSLGDQPIGQRAL